MISAIVFLPLLGAIGAGFFALTGNDRGAVYRFNWRDDPVDDPRLGCFHHHGCTGIDETVVLARWISSGGFDVNWALRFDTLTAVMVIVVTTVSTMVHIYSVGYMSHDNAKPRFMAYLSLFTFAMLMLVTADNLVQMFFGWEGVGVASYLLIGFWYHRPSAHEAAMKAFVVNRVGDFGFALGIFAIFALAGSVQLDDIFAAAPSLTDMRIHYPGMGASGA